MSKYWGNRQWYWYHMMSYTSPKILSNNDKKLYKDIIYLMTKLIPCPTCYGHFIDYLKNTPIDFTNQETMIKWFFTAHNFVNSSLKKQVLSKEEADDIYIKNNSTSISLLKPNLENNDTEILNAKTSTDLNYELKPINHSYLNEFIKYHAERAIYNYEPYIYVAKLIERLINIYPCKQCREIILEYNKKNPIRILGVNPITFRKWYYNFFDKQNLSNHFTYNWKNIS